MMKKVRLVFIVAVCVVVIVAILRLEDRKNQRGASDVGVGTNVIRTATPVQRSGEGSPKTEVALEKSSVALSPMRGTDSVLVRLEPGHPKPAHIVKAQKDGAQAKITFLVVDDKGRPVPDATVAGGFYNHERDGHGFSRKTQNDGTVELMDLCVWEINYGVEKSGYYETRGRYDFYKAGFDCVKDGRWIPWNPTVEVILKRKVNPVAMYVAGLRKKHTLIREVGEPMGFDLTVGDWVSPRGRGKTPDFHVTYIRDGSGRDYTALELILSAEEPFAGFIKVPCDTFSQFKSPYRADTNAVYAKEMRFSFRRNEKGRYEDGQLQADECLILRTRTRLDKEGRLVGAHYGKIYGPLRFGFSFDAPGEMKILHYLNPNENDPNLEADTSRNLLNPKDLGFAP
jgi:hypothetical protein